MSPLDRHIERLQAMRAAANGSSDFATDLLDVLDIHQDYLDAEPARETLAEVESYLKGVPTSRSVVDVADKAEWLAGEMDELLETVGCHGYDDVRPAVQSLEDLRADLLVLLVDAGLAEPNVMPDDPIGILRMFLPVE